MKMHELIQFKTKLEDKREMFILHSLPDNEWQTMLSRAKTESCDNEKKENIMYSFLSSMRLSFALSLAIILAFMVTYSSFSSLNAENIERKYDNTAIAPRVSPPAVNVSIDNFI